jgi:hypothetical protein
MYIYTGSEGGGGLRGRGGGSIESAHDHAASTHRTHIHATPACAFEHVAYSDACQSAECSSTCRKHAPYTHTHEIADTHSQTQTHRHIHIHGPYEYRRTGRLNIRSGVEREERERGEGERRGRQEKQLAVSRYRNTWGTSKRLSASNL